MQIVKSEFSTFERRMEILSILINQRLISCPELARRFRVFDDTITRDISVLSRFAPIGSKIGRYGGVYIINEYKREGITDSNSCAQCLLNFRSAVLSGFARRQPCFTLQEGLNKNFSAHWVCEFKKSKFFARKGKSAVNSLSINEHFNALSRQICIFEPHGVRVCYA